MKNRAATIGEWTGWALAFPFNFLIVPLFMKNVLGVKFSQENIGPYIATDLVCCFIVVIAFMVAGYFIGRTIGASRN